MKFNSLFVLMAAGALMWTACQPEENPNIEPEVKSDKCRLESLTVVTSSGKEIEASLYSSEKVAEVAYLNEDVEGLKEVTLKWTVSDKAAVDVEEDVVYNLLEDTPSFTITAEDGEHSATWTVEAVLATVVVACEIADQAVPSKFGINRNSPSGNTIAFCGVDKIATINGEVYDFDGNKVGDLNYEGLPEGAQMMNISNDDNGVVVAGFAFNNEGVPALTNDDVGYNGYVYVYCWKNGYDRAPVLLYTNVESESRGNTIGYLNCGGDVNGDFILASIFGGRGANQSFHTFTFHNGDVSSLKWAQFSTTYTGNDGNYGAMLAPASGDINGTFFIGDSMGNNLGYHVYTRNGIQDTGEDVSLKGTTMTTDPGVATSGIPDGNAEYGNYSQGNLKAFVYNGIPCVAVASTGWPKAYLTIQTNDPSDEENHYILETQHFDASQVTPSVAYVYDPATDTGNVLLLGGLKIYARYEIKREIL